MAKNALIPFTALLLLSTSTLFLFFLILPGSTPSPPFSKTYFLRADTSFITGARPISQWTYLYICGDHNSDCTNPHAATPFGSAWSSRAANVPLGLGGSHGGHTTSARIFFMWRFAWVLILLTLFFEVLSLLVGLGACCGRLGALVAFFNSAVALLFYSVAAGLTTATFVKARDRFHDAGRSARIGPWAFGWLWGGHAALLLATVLFAMGISGGKSKAPPKSSMGESSGKKMSSEGKGSSGMKDQDKK